jgi:hypothetical protein
MSSDFAAVPPVRFAHFDQVSQSPLPVSTWHDDEGTVYASALRPGPRLLQIIAIL